MQKCNNLLQQEPDSGISLDVLHEITLKLWPHIMMVASYRNDMMALSINECTDERVLYIAGGLHCHDVIDRLCGNVEIRNPFKSITDRTVELKNMVPLYYSGDSKIDLSDKDVAIATDRLGENAVRLLGLRNEELNQELLQLMWQKVSGREREKLELMFGNFADYGVNHRSGEMKERLKI